MSQICKKFIFATREDSDFFQNEVNLPIEHYRQKACPHRPVNGAERPRRKSPDPRLVFSPGRTVDGASRRLKSAVGNSSTSAAVRGRRQNSGSEVKPDTPLLKLYLLAYGLPAAEMALREPFFLRATFFFEGRNPFRVREKGPPFSLSSPVPGGLFSGT